MQIARSHLKLAFLYNPYFIYGTYDCEDWVLTQNMGNPMSTQTRTQTNIQKYTLQSLGLGMELKKWIHTLLGWIQIELSRNG